MTAPYTTLAYRRDISLERPAVYQPAAQVTLAYSSTTRYSTSRPLKGVLNSRALEAVKRIDVIAKLRSAAASSQLRISSADSTRRLTSTPDLRIGRTSSITCFGAVLVTTHNREHVGRKCGGS